MPRIEEMYAFVAEESGPDDEGIVGMKTPDGWMPMVGADMARVNSLLPTAYQLAKTLGRPIKILRFTHREDLQQIK